MQNGLYIALSAQVSLQRRLDSIAGNVANMNTPGYRAEGVTFAEEVAKAGDNRLSYVNSGDNFVSQQSGPLTRTDNPLDIAIQGDGWFAVNHNGQTIYTRDGRMTISDSGELQNINGAGVLDAGGAPIRLDPAGGAPAISADGMISQGGRQVGAVGLFTLDEDAKLTRAGDSGFTSDKQGNAVLEFTRNSIVQGAIEGANINPIEQMTKLIALQRNFEQVGNEVNQTEGSLTDAIKSLGSTAS